jgi:putative flippase GtrA
MIKRVASVALSWSAVRFVLVGLANTVLGLAIIYALKLAFGMRDLAANLLGYMLGIGISYAAHAAWSFSYRGPLRSALPRYVVVTVLAYLANLATVSAALYWWQVNGYVAQALGVPPYALVGYLGARTYVFYGRHRPGPGN